MELSSIWGSTEATLSLKPSMSLIRTWALVLQAISKSPFFEPTILPLGPGHFDARKSVRFTLRLFHLKTSCRSPQMRHIYKRICMVPFY